MKGKDAGTGGKPRGGLHKERSAGTVSGAGPAGKGEPERAHSPARSAIVLVGGEGRRVNGLEKYFFRYQGETFISRLVGNLHGLVDEIILVARSPEQCSRFTHFPDVRCTSDIRKGIGPVGGLHAGALEASGEELFVTACDMPFVNPAVVRHLFSLLDGYDAVIPSWNSEMIEPLHAVYSRRAILSYFSEHSTDSLRSMVRGLNVLYVDAGTLETIDPGLRTFININRLTDLQKINERRRED